MSALIPINNINVNFEVIDGEVFITSLQLADVFGKRHKDVIRIIANLPDDEFKAQNFKGNFYINSQNKRQPCFNLTRDGFSLLVMGFTGERAYRWKVEFINAFNMMEQMIKSSKISDNNALNVIANAMQTMLTQNATILELLKVKNEPFMLCDKPISRVYHKRLSNEEKFLEKVIGVLKKDEGLSQAELLSRIGRRKDDRTALKWLHSYDGIYWRANLLDAGRYTYSYSLIEE